MTQNRRVVLQPRVVGDQLPEWASGGVVILEWLRQQGRWEEATELLKIQREGGYAGVDALVFLLYYFASGLRVGVKEFSERAREQHKRLAAVGGRRRLPTQSSMSRILAAVESDTAQSFGNWLLQQGPEIASVLQHPTVLTRDAVGDGWHIFDWDPTVTTLRHRALPELDGTPEARRRSNSIAAPGYPGRKRGDVQFSRATLQHAGSGLWLGIEMAPGNGAPREAFQGALEQAVATCEHAAIDRERAILRADGVAGNVPFITACIEAGVHYITRLAHYQLLQDPNIVAHLKEATWFDVPSSGSGPTRQACDLGQVQLEPAPGTVGLNGRVYDAVEVRVIVSRFPSRTDSGRGAGVVIDGWQYELYGTDLSAMGWPEAEIVAGYYGRSGQENRFHQEDRELGLDRIFSYHLPGQQLATLVGLFVWNFQICRGMDLARPPQDLTDQLPTEVSPACVGAALPIVETAESTPVAEVSEPSVSTEGVKAQSPCPSDASDREGARSEGRDRLDAVDELPMEVSPAREGAALPIAKTAVSTPVAETSEPSVSAEGVMAQSPRPSDASEYERTSSEDEDRLDAVDELPIEVSPACEGAALPIVETAESTPVAEASEPSVSTDGVMSRTPRPSNASDRERASSEEKDRLCAVDKSTSNPPTSGESTPSGRATTRRDVIELMDVLNWKSMLERHGGWDWSGPQGGLHCPAKVVLPLIRIENVKGQKIRARFQALGGACSSCALREDCIRSDDPNYKKDVRLPLPATHAASLRKLWLRLPQSQRRAPSQNRSPSEPPSRGRAIWRLKPLGWEPPQPRERSPFAVHPPALLPAELRKLTRTMMQHVDVHVRVDVAVGPNPCPVLALSGAERQKRRLSWSERLRWNALPEGSSVEIYLRGASEIAELLNCSPPEPLAKSA